MRLISAIFASLFLTTCVFLAKDDDQFTWVKTDRPSVPMILFIVDQSVVDSFCPSGYIACAVNYKYPDGTWAYCNVYTSYSVIPDKVIQHEKKHCDGWDHIEK